MQKNHNLKVGLFGIGLDTYWPQFEGLKDRLEGYLSEVDQQLRSFGAEMVNLGLIDNPEKAFEAGHRFRREDVDLIFLYVTTYALSSTVLPVVKRAGLPVIVLNLSPEPAIDYEKFNSLGDRTKMTGEWLAFCSACPVPEIANVFGRAGIRFHQVTGYLHGDESCWKEISEWIQAAGAVNGMYHNRLGCLGHYYSGMLDVYTDLTAHYAHFGGHVELLEVDELSAIRKDVTAEETDDRVDSFFGQFEVDPNCSAEELRRAAKTSVALDKLVDKHQLGSLAYYYKGEGIAENMDTVSSIILGTSLLTARGIPVAGEYEVNNVQAMKILDLLGAGGSFTEYYAMDFQDDIVLMGHDGPGHPGIAEGKIRVKPLEVYHGKVGKGLSVEMSVKYGPVTLLSVVQKGNGKLVLLVAEAESVPGPILEIGNTNSRYRFPCGAKHFVENWNIQGPAHHCAVGTGHVASVVRKIGLLAGMEVVQIC